MFDSALITSLGVPGCSLVVLWQISKLFISMAEKKDAAHALERKELDNKQRSEREEFLKRIDVRDNAFRQLESDFRNTFSATIMENTNTLKENTGTLKQAIVSLSKKR